MTGAPLQMAGSDTPAEGCPSSHPGQDDPRARTLYRTFNGFAATRVRKVRHSRVMPPVVVQLGELAGLIYRSDKGHPDQPSTYIHFMEVPPVLASNPEGTQLYLIGGDYRVTSRGIEG